MFQLGIVIFNDFRISKIVQILCVKFVLSVLSLCSASSSLAAYVTSINENLTIHSNLEMTNAGDNGFVVNKDIEQEFQFALSSKVEGEEARVTLVIDGEEVESYYSMLPYGFSSSDYQLADPSKNTHDLSIHLISAIGSTEKMDIRLNHGYQVEDGSSQSVSVTSDQIKKVSRKTKPKKLSKAKAAALKKKKAAKAKAAALKKKKAAKAKAAALKKKKAAKAKAAALKKKKASRAKVASRKNKKRNNSEPVMMALDTRSQYADSLSVESERANSRKKNKKKVYGKVGTLNWLAPQYRSNGESIDENEIIGYRVFIGEHINFLTKYKDTYESKDTSISIENIKPGTYYFAVSAIDIAGLISKASVPVLINL